MIDGIPDVDCAACLRPVSRITLWRSEARQAYIVKVECHGERDECEIPDSLLASGPIKFIGRGKAFTRERVK